MLVMVAYRAIRLRRSAKDIIFHSVRGVQHKITNFREKFEAIWFIWSMCRQGDCLDNAVAESIFSFMKIEMVNLERNQGNRDTLHPMF